ncbi:MAG: HAMP domain-containing sensor histidine kinase [Dyadobacter sp.]|uniref:sensor histidine kinase n=1 Tax=Dyadobacter sp. TaxID=1914288 RepID=UPI00326693C8
MNLSFLEWPVRKQLALETNILNRARIKVLSYSLHLRLVTTGMLLVYYMSENYQQQASRIAILMGIAVVFYVALAMGCDWRKAVHVGIMIFLMIILSNLFIYQKGFHLVTLQYVVIISIYAFYGLGNRWGIIYSLAGVIPFVLYILFESDLGTDIPWGPEGTGKVTVTILLFHNFFFLVLINYYFFTSFYKTIDALDARTMELTASLDYVGDSQKKLEAEFVHQKHLIASISHDIKTPLRFLMTTTGRLARNHPDLPTVRAISQSSYRLYHFMKNLLEYTEFRYKNTTVNFTYLDVSELVDQKFEIFASEAESNSNTFTNSITPGVILKSNQQLVGIILHNLIDNANKVTNDGTIEVTYQDFRDTLHIIVNDTGPGMDARIMNWINSDHKLPGPEHNPQSFGMGLLIVKEISNLINAKLFAERFDPTGTSIHIIFPKK